MVHGADGTGATRPGLVRRAAARRRTTTPGATCRTSAPTRSARCRTAPRRPSNTPSPTSRSPGWLSASGDAAAASRSSRRSQNWANVFDTATGYIQPRDADGAFPSGTRPPPARPASARAASRRATPPSTPGWCRRTCAALFAGIGGDRPRCRAARHALHPAQRRAERALLLGGQRAGAGHAVGLRQRRRTLEDPGAPCGASSPRCTRRTPGGEPGNDDLGAMSSWYVWAAIGVYPQTPGVPMLVLGAPLFPRAVIHAGANGPWPSTRRRRRRHIRTCRPRRRRPAHASRRGSMLPAARTTLDFSLSRSPNTTWGTAAADAPPSFGAGPVCFPPATRAARRRHAGPGACRARRRRPR